MKKTLLLISFLLLASCSYKDLYPDYTEKDHINCMDYGFKPGTQGYSDCRVRLDERRHATKLEKERHAHKERMEREQGDSIQRTVNTLGSLFSKKKRKQVCRKTSRGLECGRVCLEDTWGKDKCGNDCMKDRWGKVKCGNACGKDKWGDVECN